ncbi:hypothetical protein Tco_0858361 [Tanacetum coccineum]|uniref:Uncharacterized protein n=1 Tax=Tanacetum coccineum TaxID=301880 RepID=A0ABQ5BEL2_9ASTR
MGEGSTNPTDPHHTPTITQPSTQPQKTQKPRKPKRKDTQVPQPSDPNDNVADKDSGNITKTRSKATPNESSSLRTTSSFGLRCQETIGDTIAQTRFENVSKLSNDLLLARGNTLRSDGGGDFKLNELMELCTTLQKKVLDLEKTKTTQANEISSLKMRVMKLEKKRSLRTHKLKRLYKVGLSARVESSGDEESLGEDASKQARINAIDADEDITLVNVQDDADNEVYDVGTATSDEVFAEHEVAVKDVNLTVNEVTLAQALAALKSCFQQRLSAATTITITTEEITFAQALEALKTSKPKVKGIVLQEPKPKKPLKKKDQLKLDEDITLKLQAEIYEEERITKAKEEKIDEANIAWDDIQAKVDADYQLAKRLQAEE